jgi:hypothetical protein
LFTWHLKQYNNAYDAFVSGLDHNLVRAIEARIGTLLLKGVLTPFPTVDPLGEGLFEVRAKHKNVHAQLLFGYLPGQTVVVVYCTLKARRKLPPRAIERARKLLAEAKRTGAIHVTHRYPSRPN